MSKKYICDKCNSEIKKDEKTKIKLKGLQNFTAVICFKCLCEFTNDFKFGR